METCHRCITRHFSCGFEPVSFAVTENEYLPCREAENVIYFLNSEDADQPACPCSVVATCSSIFSIFIVS